MNFHGAEFHSASCFEQPSEHSDPDTGSVTTLSFSPDGRQLLVGTKRGDVDCGHLTLLNLQDLKTIRSISVARGGRIEEAFDVLAAAFSNNKRIFSCDAGRRMMVWDPMERNPLIHRFGVCQRDEWGFQSIYATSAIFSPKGSFLGIVSKERAAIVRLPRLDSPINLFLSKMRRSSSKLSIGKWEKDPAPDLALGRPPAVSFSVDESLVALPVRNEIRFLDTRKGLCRRTTFQPEGVRALAFSPQDSTWIAAGLQGGGIVIQDVETARSRQLGNHERTPTPTSFLAFDAQGSVLGSVSQNEVKLWDHRTKTCLRLASRPANVIAFPPSGDLLATSDSYSGTVNIWDIRSLNRPQETVPISNAASPRSSVYGSPVLPQVNLYRTITPPNRSSTPQLRGYPSTDTISFDYEHLREKLTPLRITILRATNIFLKVTDWTGCVAKTSEFSIGGGCFGDVYKGKWINIPEGVQFPPPVAIKVIRPLGFDDPIKRQEAFVHLRREVTVWQRMRHENILPFLGISNEFGVLPSLISPWMRNGTVKSYLRNNPTVQRKSLLVGIANGLDYLHGFSPSITHGDLKPANVLIDHRGRPRLTDFGLSRMHEEASLWQTTASAAPGTIRYMAPELLSGMVSISSIPSDVYAYALTSWEIVTGRIPFSQYKHDGAVLAAVTFRDERPQRLIEDITPETLLSLWSKCWHSDAEQRPSMGEICQSLSMITVAF